MTAPSAWERFADSVTRGVTSREDLESFDLVALAALDDGERERARALLAARLGKGDPRVVDALAALGTQAAWDEVERALTDDWGHARVHAAARMWERTHEPRAIEVLAEEARRNATAPSLLADLLTTLERIDDPAADALMIDILAAGSDRGVTAIAIERLFVRHGFDRWDEETCPIFTLRMGLASIFPSVRAAAVDALRALVERRRAGASDEDLGIAVPAPDPDARPPVERGLLMLAVRPGAPVPDADAVLALTGGERDSAIDVLLARLAQDDTRVLPLLERLGGARVTLALGDYRAGRRLAG